MACLFIGATEALPQKVSLIGLDLTGKPEIFGWFLLGVTGYFFVTSLVLVLLELTKYYLPYFIIKKGANVTSSTLGLTEDDCQSENFEHYLDQPEVGTTYSELKDIQRQRKNIEASYTTRYLKLANITRLSFDLAFPMIFSATSIFILSSFLWTSHS